MNRIRSPDYADPRSREHDGPVPQLDKREASQGIRGHNVRFVLLVGTSGAVVALGLAYLFFFA